VLLSGSTTSSAICAGRSLADAIAINAQTFREHAPGNVATGGHSSTALALQRSLPAPRGVECVELARGLGIGKGEVVSGRHPSVAVYFDDARR
jgi:hypothetical protein